MFHARKLSILILLAFLCTFIASACQNESPIVEVEEKPVYKDMGGAKFIIATGWINQSFPDPAYTAWGDKILDRYAQVEENFNCDLVRMDLATVNHGTFLTEAVVAGIAEGIPDFFFIHGFDAYKYYKADMLYPFDEITTIDITDPRWGPEKFRRYGIFGDKPYGIFPYDWEMMPETAGTLWYNCELMKANNISDPYELYEQGQWNWANFKEYLKTCTITDKEISGLGVNNAQHFVKSMVFSNNGEVVKEEDGKYRFSLADSDALAAMDYINELKTEKLVVDGGGIEFVDQKFMFLNAESWNGTHNDTWMENKYPAAVMKDFNLIPMPYGPNGSKDTVSGFVNTSRAMWWTPRDSANDRDDWGLLMNEIFKPLEGSEPQAWKPYSAHQVFHYTNGYDNFVYMIENVRYDYSAELSEVNVKLETVLTNIYRGGSGIENINKITDAINVELDKINIE